MSTKEKILKLRNELNAKAVPYEGRKLKISGEYLKGFLIPESNMYLGFEIEVVAGENIFEYTAHNPS